MKAVTLPTALSWTELGSSLRDLRAVLAFRFGAVKRPRALRIGITVFVLITVCFAVFPAYLDGSELPAAAQPDRLWEQLRGGFPGFLLIILLSAVAAGGGREVVARDQAVAFPITPATDHFGALVMAPLNMAWIAQAWMLMAASAYITGPQGLVAGQVLILLWILMSTAAAQLLGWSLEWVRRGPGGRAILIALAVGSAITIGILQWLGVLGDLLAVLPTAGLAEAVYGARDGLTLQWFAWVAGLIIATLVITVVGVLPAGAVARRPAREEDRVDSRRHPARDDCDSVFAALLRVDRAGVARSVPLRRGMVMLTLMPGLGSLAAGSDWEVLGLIPGLVASGAVLLFGVNAWALDGRGLLWRETLPVPPALVFDVRTRLLAETLGIASLITLLVGAARSGMPSVSQVAAAVAALVVVVAQVTASAMNWSVRNPFSTDLRSARATPAPPMVMVGYSARLALVTTLTGMLFGAFGAALSWWQILVAALPFLAWSSIKWLRARRVWIEPHSRALVTVTVTA